MSTNDEPDAPDGPLVTDEIRTLIGRELPAAGIDLDPDRIRAILDEVGEPGLPLDGDLPPWLLAASGLGLSRQDEIPELLPVSAVMQADWHFVRRVRAGEPLSATARITDIRDRVGGRHGHTVMITLGVDVMNSSGEVVVKFQSSRLQFNAPGAPIAQRDGPPAAADDSATPLADTLTWGGPLRSFAEVSVGDTIGPRLHLGTPRATTAFLPLFRRVLRTQSTDIEAAHERGYQGLVLPICAHMCWIGRMASQWAGDPFALRAIRGAFREPDYIGRPTTARGVVVQTQVVEGEGLVDMEFGAFAAGQQTVRAHAQVVLPI